MKKKTLKGLLSIAVSAAMLATMAVSAFAADATLTEGVTGDVSGAAQENSVLILKELKVYNTDGKDIYLPTVGYDYTIAAATVDEGVTVTDNQPVTSIVYSGVPAALTTTTASVDFSPATTAGYTAAGAAATITQPTAAAKTGTSYFGGFSVEFDPSKFEHSGIYRYVITEADDATNTLTSAGVVHQDEDYVATRYLDVYVRDAVAADNVDTDELICGYVLWVPAADQDQNTSIDNHDPNNVEINVSKTNGYVDATGGDEYNTYNLEVEKAVEGALANKDNNFPFQIVLSNGTTAKMYYTTTDNGTTTTDVTFASGAATIGTLAEGSVVSLSNGDKFDLYGIPAGATATVQEFNNLYDVYAANMEADATNNGSFTYTENNVQAQSTCTVSGAVANNTTTAAVGTAYSKVTVTNTLKTISPTGVVLRYAPYFIMAVAAIALVAVAKRAKRNEEA